MTVMRLAGFAALSVLIAACSPAPVAEQAAPETAAPETAAPDTAAPDTAAPEATGPAAAALHVLLVENAEDLVPSDWTTGEPVSETSLSYWVLPALDVAETRSAVCTPLTEPARAHDCTLSFVAEPVEANRRPVEARFRFSVAESPDGDLALISPTVRWAVTG
ncbi:hypothetical protein L2D00_08210 [Hyphomonadaceae bacterium BL14]|nr:hypothetical protein L2D00_08210 [Hyphomonadaceae bacterium BL14]